MTDQSVLSILEYLYGRVEAAFKEHPHRFFTEHDIHSELYLIAKTLLKEENALHECTCDGFPVNRVHHEYPTPFRCIMKGSEFRVVTEDEFKLQRKTNSSFRARRGWMDFVVLNSDFISSNKLNVVSGKRYPALLKSLEEQKHPALDLAVEVVYYPVFDERPHEGMMRRKIASTIQDYNKLVAVMEFTYPSGTSFCKEAGLMLFSNTAYARQFKELIETVPLNERVSFFHVQQSAR